MYEPYCANYTNAADIMIKEEQNLSVRGLLSFHLGSSPTRFPCEPGRCDDGGCRLHPKIAHLMCSHPLSGLQVHNNLINAKSELPAFLIKPVQRICKYPLLLDVSDLILVAILS